MGPSSLDPSLPRCLSSDAPDGSSSTAELASASLLGCRAGQRAVLISPGGEVVLFDAGAAGECGKPLAYLQALGLTTIDYHIATSDASGDLACAPDILVLFPLTKAAFDPGERGRAEALRYTSGTPGESATTAERARHTAAVGTRRQTVGTGRRITLDAQSAIPVTIDLIGDGVGEPRHEGNPGRNLVAVVRFGGFAAELGGNLTAAMEHALADRVGPVDVYRVHNHGSRESAGARWLSIVRPRIGIVSTSINNAERTPTPKAMARLHAAGVTTYWTSLGNGVPSVPGRDVVTGNIVVEVARDATSFTVRTSGQGETVSGVITNFGWALTPKPNTIPLDGSTIDVFVDILRGHPVYNNYRVDVATLFPGLNNSTGAGGHFSLDTRTLSNGIHTISWVVRDNAGNAQGVGSRYFTVQNP